LIFATPNLSQAIEGRVNRPPPEAAYGPSQIISSRRRGKQIDLWMALIEQFNMCEQPVAMTQDKGGSMAL
jgi:hypothetical protein